MGVFIAIEGGDGSGKATQALELETKALAYGYDVLHVSFPNYGSPTARFIEKYLNGKYGPAKDVPAELASMLYAVDRYAASEKIRNHLKKPHSLVIADRYVVSNLAHQGAKLHNTKDRRAFYDTILDLEYTTFKLPKPDINIVLVVPVPVAQENIDNRPTRDNIPAKLDEHEKDEDHLKRTSANYAELTEMYPDRFVSILCMENDGKQMRSVQAISNDIWNVVYPLLRARS